MAIEAKTLSLWDAGRFYFRVSFPALLLGLVAPNRLFLSWLSRLSAGQSTLRMLKAFREKYRCDHLWFRFIGGRTTTRAESGTRLPVFRLSITSAMGGSRAPASFWQDS